jgi:putative acetyltransferase
MNDQEGLIRKTTPKDASQIGRVYNTAIIDGDHYTEYKEDALLFPDNHPPKKLYNQDSNITYVVEIQDQIVAWSSLNLDNQFLDGLFVDPDYQSRGFGSRLIEKIEEEAKDQGLNQIYIASDPHIVPYYTSKNYQVMEETTMKGIEEEKDVKCVILAKIL